MIEVPLPQACGDARAWLRLEDGSFRVEVDSVGRSLRPWRWGERRRMVEGCSLGGRLRREAFVSAICSTLYEPAPGGDLERHAWIALTLMGVRAGLPFAERDHRLARAFGWTPGDLEQEPVQPLDRLLEQIDDTSPVGGSGDGWTRIVVNDAP